MPLWKKDLIKSIAWRLALLVICVITLIVYSINGEIKYNDFFDVAFMAFISIYMLYSIWKMIKEIKTIINSQ